MQSSDDIKKNMSSISMKVGANTASVVRELAITMRNMTRSNKLDILVEEMNGAAQDLRDFLKYPNMVNPTTSHSANGEEVAANIKIPLMDIIQVVTVASLLIEIVARVEDIVKAVEELSDLAQFQLAECEKPKQVHSPNNKISPDQEKDEKDIKILQMV